MSDSPIIVDPHVGIIGRAPQFDDPEAVEPELLRCWYCKRVTMMHVDTGYDRGCEACGSRRMGPAGNVSDAEMKDLIRRGFNPTNYDYVPNHHANVPLTMKPLQEEKDTIRKRIQQEWDYRMRKAEKWVEWGLKWAR